VVTEFVRLVEGEISPLNGKATGDLAVETVFALARTIQKRFEVDDPKTTAFDVLVFLRACCDMLESYISRPVVQKVLAKRSKVGRLTTLPLLSASELYQQFAVRFNSQNPNVSASEFRDLLVKQAVQFANCIEQSKKKISLVGQLMFTRHEMYVVTHGRSSCVGALLQSWCDKRKVFSLFISRHSGSEEDVRTVDEWATELRRNFACPGTGYDVPIKIVDVAIINSVLSKQASFVVVGAEAVTENGGIINRIGTSTVAMVAKQMGRPVYVVCEACKFVRFLPTDQKDITKFRLVKRADAFRRGKDSANSMDIPLSSLSGLTDYTPPNYVSLLFTDLGVFPPWAVSDELTKAYRL